jgi:gas vesicle protein
MEQNQMINQIIEFNKASFDRTYDALIMMQNQAEMITRTYVEQADRISSEGRKVLSAWVDAFNQNRNELKKSIDSGFEHIESCFAENKKTKKS